MKKWEKIAILVVINLITFYYLVMGPIPQTAHPIIGEKEVKASLSLAGFLLWLTILFLSVVLFLRYGGSVRKNDALKKKIFYIINNCGKINAYQIRKMLIKLDKERPGLQPNTVKSILKELVNEGKITREDNNYSII
ncbi:hypothetical protein FP803_03925 [Candidatus Woesearchaeota archaeon]|nr:hypothetical protein [Candidatus Woesearchaeota archaeon]MBU3912856.1 hypothetical protein [Nanoarchaeota archaeon]